MGRGARSPRPRPSDTVPPMLPQQGQRRPTMRDVAALAGVSLSTVSRVVTGSQQVDPELAVKVEKAVEMLGYRHNLAAGNLRRADGLSASIGLVFEDVSNPFFSAVHRGIEDVARSRSVLTFAGSSDEDPARERELTEAFLGRRVDGLVIVPAAPDHSYLARDVAAGMALVFVDRPPRFIDADAVVSDNVGGARTAVAHLARGGPPPDRLPGRSARRSSPPRSGCADTATPRRRVRRDAGPPPGVPRRRRRRDRARAAGRPEPADGAVHRPEPDHARRAAHAARARTSSTRSRSSASTTSRSARCCSRA